MNESIIDIPRKDISQDIFDREWVRQDVREKILKLAAKYSQWMKIERVLLIGSILTKQWNEETDLDITLVGQPYSEEQYDLARHYAAETENQNLITTHPINFFVRDEWDDEYADQIYDVLNNRLLKMTEIQPVDINNYMEDFKKIVSRIDTQKEELDKDLVDYEKLQYFDHDELKDMKQAAKEKLAQIEEGIKKLVSTYKAIHQFRKLAFSSNLTPEQVEKFKVRNALPASVLWKLLEKAHYIVFLKALQKAYKGQDIETVTNLVRNFKPGGSAVAASKVEATIAELTGSSAAGAYDAPLGQYSQGRKRFKKKKKLTGILTF